MKHFCFNRDFFLLEIQIQVGGARGIILRQRLLTVDRQSLVTSLNAIRLAF